MIEKVNIFCSECFNDNLYLLEYFYKTLIEVQNSKKDPGALAKLDNIIDEHRHINQQKSKQYDISIIDLLYRRVKSYAQLDSMREVLNEDVMALLDILWDKCLKGNDTHHRRLECVIEIIRHILTAFPKRKIYRTDVLLTMGSGEKIDAYDVLFNFITVFCENFELGHHVEKFLKMARSLFYYQARRVKDKETREEVIYVAFQVILQRDVTYIAPHEESPVKLQETIYEKLKKNPYEYLKAITHVNSNLIECVRSEFDTTMARWAREQKMIHVESFGDHMAPSPVSIIKI